MGRPLGPADVAACPRFREVALLLPTWSGLALLDSQACKALASRSQSFR